MNCIIVAVSEDGIIGRDGSIPWYCPADMEMFRRMTWGREVVAGRKTYESLPDVAKEGRAWHVLSRTNPTGIFEESGSLDVLDDFGGDTLIAGGGSIYRQSLERKLVDRVFLTRIPVVVGSGIEWCGLPDGWEKVRGRNVEAAVKGDEVTGTSISYQEWVPSSDR